MTSFHDDTPFWDEPDWSGITDTPRPRRTYGERTRTHHVVVRKTPLPPLERSRDADFWSEEWPDDEDFPGVDAWVEPLETAPRQVESRRRGVGVDPRLLRLGALTAAIVLMVPIALALRDDGRDGDLRSTDVGGTGAETTTTAGPSRLADAGAAHQRRVRERRPTKQSTSTLAEPATATAADSNDDGDGDGDGEAMSVSATPEEPACAAEYTVVAGDYWVRFAESSGTDLGAWLNANGATAETPLYAGDVLCVPAGARIPEPPPSTTDAPETTPAPTTTEAPETTPAPTDAPMTTDAPATTEAPTTDAPTTTEAPATTPQPPPAPVSPGTVEAIIRAVWPDELEERALVIAQRESSLQPDAYNGWCCYGLFQIYFDANRSFLASLGVTTPQQLFDARTNAAVAYAMYQRSGWSPWSSTTY
jgi:cell division septation protein DedD